jgi:hypothetical protein
MSMLRTAVFRDVAPCSLVDTDRRFRRANWRRVERQQASLKHRSKSTRLHSATSQKTAIFILVAVRTSNLTYVDTDNREERGKIM